MKTKQKRTEQIFDAFVFKQLMKVLNLVIPVKVEERIAEHEVDRQTVGGGGGGSAQRCRRNLVRRR